MIEWQGGSEYRNQKFLGVSGALLAIKMAEKITLNARLFFQYQGLVFQTTRNSSSFFQPGGELALFKF